MTNEQIERLKRSIPSLNRIASSLFGIDIQFNMGIKMNRQDIPEAILESNELPLPTPFDFLFTKIVIGTFRNVNVDKDNGSFFFEPNFGYSHGGGGENGHEATLPHFNKRFYFVLPAVKEAVWELKIY